MSNYIEKLTAPIEELNTLAVKNIEKLVQLQLKTLQDNANIGVGMAKSAASVSDLEGLRDFLNDQAEVAKRIAEDIVANARTVVELSQDYVADVKDIAEDSIKAVK